MVKSTLERVQGFLRPEHLLRAVANAGQLDKSPVESPALRLGGALRFLEDVQSPLQPRCALRLRFRAVVELLVTEILLAEKDGDGRRKIAAQLGRRLAVIVDIAQSE